MQSISEFLKGYHGMTLLGYRSAIFQFIDARYGPVRKGKDSTQEERGRYEQLAQEYLDGDVKPLEDLKSFKDSLSALKRPPHSISQNVACVKIWLEHYEHPLNSKELRELKKHMPRQRAGVTREDDMDADTIRLILSHTGDIRLRAACLLMISSGIRIGELVQLTKDDIKMDKKTIDISDLISKSGEKRVTFFTDEAKEALQQYMTERETFMIRAQKMSTRISKPYDITRDELFPITPAAIRNSLISALKRAGIYRADKRTARTTIHPHSFRKFFSSTLKMAGCPDEVVEELMGHRAGLASSYRRFGESQLRKKYEDFSHVLTVGDYGFEARKELKARVDSQADKMLGLERENEALQERLKQVEQVQETNTMLEKMAAMKRELMAEIMAEMQSNQKQ